MHEHSPENATKVKEYILSILITTITELSDVSNSMLELLLAYLVEPAKVRLYRAATVLLGDLSWCVWRGASGRRSPTTGMMGGMGVQKESPAAYVIVQRLMKDAESKLQEPVTKFLRNLLSGKLQRSELAESKYDLLFELNLAAPDMIGVLMPQLVEEITVRRRALLSGFVWTGIPRVNGCGG